MNNNFKILLDKLEELKNEAKEEADYHFDNSSNYPCEYNIADLQQKKYDAICEIFELVKSFQEKCGDCE